MKNYIFLLIALVILAGVVSAQNTPADSLPVNSDSLLDDGLNRLLGYMLLTKDDFTFRDDYTPKDPYRLKIVDSLMEHPLLMDDFADKFTRDLIAEISGEGDHSADSDFSLDGLFGATCGGADDSAVRLPNLKVIGELREPVLAIYQSIGLANHRIFRNALRKLSGAQREFIINRFDDLILDDPDYRIWTNEQLDSIQKTEEDWAKEFAEMGKEILPPGEYWPILRDIENRSEEIKALLVSGDESRYRKQRRFEDKGGFPIIIGTVGNDTYTGDYLMIIDPGGDDLYDLSYDLENPHPTLIVDLSGNDIYKAETDFALASGVLSYSLLIDYKGDDVYWGRNFSLGAGYFGVGILWDKKGNDKYFGDTFVQGAGTFGLGLLIDEDGSDTYTCHFQSQGFGFVRGVGGIADFAGNDTYTVQPKYKEFFHAGDHYQSLSQGFSTGVRPYMSGGFGFICDYGGNDSYVADFFTQGSAYWWSLGMIYDRSGNDQYSSYQYAQGAGAHMALGILLDEAGSDVYRAHGVSQGCGHDYSCGWLLDRGGEDIYSSESLSQGAGSANGFGIITDIGGVDGYYIFVKSNCQGYGNPRRDYGSIGLFLDLDGADHYDGNGTNNRFWRTPSKWGGGLDREIFPTKAGATK